MPQFLPGGLRDQRQGSSRESRLTNDHANESNESAGKSDHVISKKQLWTGCILSGLAALFFLMDGTMKLLKPAIVVPATVRHEDFHFQLLLALF
jgi:hypothetical protein